MFIKQLIRYSIIFLLIHQVFAKEELSGYLYKGKDVKIYYFHNKSIFIVNETGRNHKYPRHLFEKLLRKHIKNVSKADQEEVKNRIETIALTYEFSDPTTEELMKDAVEELAEVNAKRKTNCDPTVAISDSSDEERIALTNIEVRNDPNFGLGKLKGVSYEVDSVNDNVLHGGFIATGITSAYDNSGLEGDDRGLTFGASAEVKFIMDDGEVVLSYDSKAYTRFASGECGEMKIDGEGYEVLCRKDDKGRWYQEGLNRDEFQVKILKKIGKENEYYIQLHGGVVSLNDKGTSLSVQRVWHKATKDSGNIQYQNLDHLDKETSIIAGTRFGRAYNLTDPTNNVSVDADLYTGLNYAHDIDNESYVEYGGRLVVNFREDNAFKEGRFPVMQTTLYYDGQTYEDSSRSDEYGLSNRFNVRASDTSVFYLKLGIGKKKDQYTREYKDRGRSHFSSSDDYMHYFGLGYEKSL